jgi:hypothetical protein
MAWEKLGSDTLTTSGSNITSGTITVKKFLHQLYHALATGGTIGIKHNIDNLTTSSYAFRDSKNGGADNLSTSATFISDGIGDAAEDKFGIAYMINIATEEKLFIYFYVSHGGVGAGNAPQRAEVVGKQVGTSNQITETEITNTGGASGSYDTDTNLIVLGTD